AFASFVNDVERVRPIVEQFRSNLVAAPDESTQTLTLQNFVRAIFEGSTDREWRVETPVDRVRLLAFVITALMWLVFDQWADSQRDQKLNHMHHLLQNQVKITA